MLAIVGAQQLHVLGHPNGADQVDSEEEEEGRSTGPDDDDAAASPSPSATTGAPLMSG